MSLSDETQRRMYNRIYLIQKDVAYIRKCTRFILVSSVLLLLSAGFLMWCAKS